MVDFDSFLPPIMQRHHQLLLPILQLALAVTTGCGSHNSTAAKQVQSLLLDQRAAMKAVLEDATVAATMTGLQAAHLLVQLMRLTLPVLSDQELVGGLVTADTVVTLSSYIIADGAPRLRWLAYIGSRPDVRDYGGTRLACQRPAVQ